MLACARGLIESPDHSVREERLIILGMAHRLRLLVVVHTEAEGKIRIISARPAQPRERRQYEQATP